VAKGAPRRLPVSRGAIEFVRRQTRLRPLAFVPEISLYGVDESMDIWHKTETELKTIGLPPPFWAFAWPGGQALARHILDHPALVRGKAVLDFGSGSGLVAIAAGLAGASRVAASDIDPFAQAAISLNARANRVNLNILSDIIDSDHGWDVVLAADVAYEQDMAARATAWLARLARRGALVRIGDPGRAYLDQGRLVAVAVYEVPVTRELEDSDSKATSIWQFRPA
jgi:predicted nicotinamide N-methyase